MFKFGNVFGNYSQKYSLLVQKSLLYFLNINELNVSMYKIVLKNKETTYF